MFEAFSVNLRHLRALPAIAEKGSMNAAAEAIGISQPALAQGLAKLEAHYDAPLFVRAAGGMKPTEAGQQVIERARAVQARLALAMRSLPRGNRRGFERAENLLTATQIRALLCLADGGSFLGASRASGTSQPALHRAVRELEAICGVRLAARQGQRVVLTDHGRRLSRHLRVVGAELAAAAQDLAGDQGTGHIRIGAMPLCRARLLPAAIARMAIEVPDFTFDVAEGSYTELIEPLRDGRIDMAIGALRAPCPPDLRQHPLVADRLAVIARHGHPLARQADITLDALREFSWIVGREGSPLRGHWQNLFGDDLPEAPIECGSVMTIRGILAETDMLTLLSPEQIALETRSQVLTTLDLTLPSATRTIGISVRDDWRPTRLQRLFLDRLEEVARAQDIPKNQ